MDDKFCRKCYEYVEYDDNFGYCRKYNCQARHNDTCKIIMEMVSIE